VNYLIISALEAVLAAIKVAVCMSILADVVAFSHVIYSAPTDIADGSDALVSLSLNIAELQFLPLVACHA